MKREICVTILYDDEDGLLSIKDCYDEIVESLINKGYEVLVGN